MDFGIICRVGADVGTVRSVYGLKSDAHQFRWKNVGSVQDYVGSMYRIYRLQVDV